MKPLTMSADEERDLRDTLANIGGTGRRVLAELDATRARLAEAERLAVAAIYFDDSADYPRALWQVVATCDPAIVELLENDPDEAYHRTSAPEPSK